MWVITGLSREHDLLFLKNILGPVERNIMTPDTKQNPEYSDWDAWIELNLDNMGQNLEELRRKVKVPVTAVIKANGYGHGLIEVGRYLERKGIDQLFVCKLQEAMQLRNEGVSCPILNFGAICEEDADILVANDITQSVYSTHIHSLNQSGIKLGIKAKVNIHIDAGMGRVGISYRDAMPFIEEVASLKNIQITGTSITLPQDIEFDKEIVDRFLSLCRKVEKSGISLGLKHAASSNGIFASSSHYLNMVRPGILLYGYCDSEELQEENGYRFKPVLQLKSRVADVKDLLPGDSVSYGRNYTAHRSERFALISIGYSDGYPVNAVNRGAVLINGERFPIIAKITANHLEVLLRPDSQIQAGDEVVLIGSQGNEFISAFDVAHWGDVSIYQLLARLNPLLPRKVLSSAL